MTNLISMGASANGPYLKHEVHAHCMTNINDKAVLMIGGFQADASYAPYISNETWLYHLQAESSEWELTATFLNTARFAHSCGLLYDSSEALNSTFYLVAFGGIIWWDPPFSDIIVDTAEMIEMSDGHEYSDLDLGWKSGTAFPYKAAHMATAQAPDKKSLFAIGGRVNLNPEVYLSTIVQLQCWNRDCQWIQWEQELQLRREAAVAFILPNAYAICNYLYL